MRSHRMKVKQVTAKIKRRTYADTDWRALSGEIKLRDNYTCQKCGRHKMQLGSTERLETDHIRQLAKGGTNSRLNLRTLCSTCHSKMPGHAHLR